MREEDQYILMEDQYTLMVENERIKSKTKSNNDFYIDHFFSRILPSLLTYYLPPWRRMLIKKLSGREREQKKLIVIDLDDSMGDDAAGVVQATPSMPQVSKVTYFINGIDFFIYFIGSPAFLGMLSYDIYQYTVFPNNRYKVNLLDFILGIPRNYNYQYSALTANWGGDLMTFWNYWPWTWMMGAAFFSGVVNYYRLGRKKNSLSQLKAWAYVEKQFLRNFFYISALADIFHYEESKSIQLEAKESLQNIAAISRVNKSLLSWAYAHYKLWTIGESRKILVHLFSYLFMTPLQLYIRMRLWSLVVNKLLGCVEYEQHRENCESENKVWHYVPERGNYDCTACDWPFVDYRSSLTGQGCLEGLFSSARSAEEVIKKLNFIQNKGPFNRIDFSKQSWTVWPLEDWQKITEILQSSDLSQAPVLNLSQSPVVVEAVSPDLIACIADYLQQADIQSLDMTGVPLSQQSLLALLPGLENNPRIRSLNLTNTAMYDQGAEQWMSVIPTLPAVHILKMADNFLTDDSLSSLGESLNRSSIIELDVSGNLFNATGMAQFADNLPYSSLQTLDISNMDLSEMDMSAFGTGISHSLISELNMMNTHLSDDSVSALFPFLSQQIRFLNWASNAIGYDGIATIARTLPDSMLASLILDDNQIDDEAITLLDPAMSDSNSTIHLLSLSGNLLTFEGFSRFAEAWSNSTLRTLRAARMPIGDEGIRAFISAFDDNSYLEELDVSSISLTNAGASDLFSYAAQSALTSLNLNYNPITIAAGEPLSLALNGSYLRHLFLSHTQITAPILTYALPALLFSQLQSLDLSDNPLSDLIASALAQTLISPVPNSNRWFSTVESDVDFNRALAGALPATQLNALSLNNVQMTPVGAHALCLASQAGAISVSNLLLQNNFFTPAETGVAGCPAIDSTPSVFTSAASSLLPNPYIRLLFFLFVAVFFLKYSLEFITAVLPIRESSPASTGFFRRRSAQSVTCEVETQSKALPGLNLNYKE